MSKPHTDMSSAAVTARLKHISAISDLEPGRRMEGKLDMRPAAVSARLRESAALLDLCRRLEQPRK